MKPRTTFRLLAVACILGLLLWYLDKRVSSGEMAGNGLARVLDIRADDVGSLAIIRESFRVDCVRKERQWFLRYPVAGRADDASIDRILSILEVLPRGETISEEQRKERLLSRKDFGLENPRARIVVVDALGVTELAVGNDSPLGDSVFVGVGAAGEIFVTAHEVLDMLPETIEQLRDRSVLPGDASRTQRLEIWRPVGGFIRLIHTAGQWMLQQPVVARADGEKATRILDAVYGLKLDRFVWDPPVRLRPEDTPGTAFEEGGDTRVETYGLAPDEALARVQVWSNGDEIGQELILGREVPEESGLIYAKVRDRESIFAVSREILDAVSIGANDLRDRMVFGLRPDGVRTVCMEAGDLKLVLERHDVMGWRITDPVQWKADDATVNGLVRRLCALRATAFMETSVTNATDVFDPAWCKVSLSDRMPPSPAAEGEVPADALAPAASASFQPCEAPRLLIGRHAAETKTVLGIIESSSSVVELPGEAVRGLLLDPSAPLLYRDRTMLAVPRASVKKISIIGDGREQSALLGEDGTWRCASDPTNRVLASVVEDILFRVSNLRAIRIDCQNPRSLAAYGLDGSGITLTLGLRGEEGIQKSVILGFKAQTDGRYAMVRGSDVVYVLAGETAENLTRDILLPEDSAEKRR